MVVVMNSHTDQDGKIKYILFTKVSKVINTYITREKVIATKLRFTML